MIRDQLILDVHDELIVVLFAGLGGMCHAIERATGRHVDIACNHNVVALACHRLNHPQTRHYQCDVFELDPVEACDGRPVGWLHASPDCTHFSQASEGQPRDEAIRSLTWVVLLWIGRLKRKQGRGPRIISLENVKQIRKWGPLIAKRDKATGRCLKVHRRADRSVEKITVAEPGERVPVQKQYLVPNKKREGARWKRFLSLATAEGYRLEDDNLVAADYGAPTTRNRLFMIARCDDKAIVFPAPTHAKKPVKPLKKHRAAAECIDWSIPLQSIFERKKPLVESTCQRLAKGVVDLVLTHPSPFIVPLTHRGKPRAFPLGDPFRTITGANRGEFALCVPMVAPMCQYNGGNIVRSAGEAFGTMTARPKGGHYALAAAFIAQHNGGKNKTPGHDPRKAFSTLTTKGCQQQLVECGTALPPLTPEEEAGALRVAAFLMRYYSNGGQWGDLRNPMPTVTTKDRLSLVTVTLHGKPGVICDIATRMFAPRELALGMGFWPDFIIDRGMFVLPDGTREERPLTRSQQIELIGNAVSPDPAEALVRANAPELCVRFGDERRQLMEAIA